MLVHVGQHNNRDANCIKDSSGNDIVMTTDSNGDTNQVELEPGTYWARETKCAKGYGENPDDANNPPQVAVVSGQTTTFETTDPPQADPTTKHWCSRLKAQLERHSEQFSRRRAIW